ncbi:MAG: hypothetical protein Q7U56_09715 [Humidesulfovibrio sp.]|nr:hypothetical protein [Humidesulfovibrio sp.]
MARLGSFAASVDLPELLRPWRAAGLDALFLPDGLPERLVEAPSTPLSAAPAPTDTACAAPSASGQRLDWPEPWAGIAARVRTAPKIIITYAALTADVTGAAEPTRRKLFQSILGYLAWPQGTCVFWPCIDAPGALHVARNIFLNGVLSFGVAHIACFGPEASAIATALFPTAQGQPEVQVHALPAPEALMDLLPHELHRSVAVLKALRLE